MRIAFVSLDPGISPSGTKGASVHIQEMVRSFRSLGHEVVIFSPRVEIEDMHTVPLTPVGKGEAIDRERRQIALNEELTDRLIALGPFDLVYERYSLFGTAAMGFACNNRIPGILEVNAPLIHEQREHRSLVFIDEAERSAAQSFTSASTIAVVSSAIRPYVIERAQSANVVVAPNGISPERFPIRSQPAFDIGAFTYAFLGSLKPWHGIEFLPEIHALVRASIPDARLLVIGDGPMRATLEEVVDDCICVGAVEPERVCDYLAAAHVGIAPYPYREPFYFSPLKIAEYMAAGLPVVASEIGDIPQIVKHGVDGVLVRPGDTREFASELIALARDDRAREVMGANARSRAHSEMTWQSIAERLLSSIAGGVAA